MSAVMSDNEAARFAAQRLAFSPLVFQACRALRDLGILEQVSRARGKGVTASEVVATGTVSAYVAALLLEAGLGAGLCTCEDLAPEPRFFITAMGVYWLRDQLTRVNAEFNHHVCYGGAFHLREALLEGRAAGLPAIDATGAATVYEALASLAPDVKKAWFDFDHYYSDGVFEACLPRVLAPGVRHVVDIGGNTGRFARLCLEGGVERMTLVDLPGQLAVARENLKGFAPRVDYAPTNVLDVAAPFPAGADVYWLSQFLDCFGEDEIRSILARVRAAMRPDSKVFILETFWNEQRYEAARFCVIGTSLYFACIANGNSRMYHSEVMKGLARDAGLVVADEVKHVGLSHSLIVLGAG
ncbi:MAG: class I SAM-dependent methyltransferase [Pseudomonadota bacterium]|nr:class I SAM-dependent methyltransferase [Pseudomonadota bacterium]